MISLIFMYKNDPLILLSPDWFIPLNRFIAFPTGVPGNVLKTAQYGKCRKISNTLFHILWPKFCFLCSCFLKYLVE